MDSENREYNLLALEEFKLLQGIARDQEELRFKIRGWCVALITALSVALLSNEIELPRKEYFLVSLMILLLFLWLDVLYRVAQDRALRRAKVVEKVLQNKCAYSGPCIRESLSVKNSLAEQLRSLNNIRVYSPYLLLAVTIMVVGYVS